MMLADGEDAVAVPVLGDVGDARRPARRRWAARRASLAVDVHRAGHESAHPGDGLGQLDLAVAGHAGDADDLAAADRRTTRRRSRARRGRCGRRGPAPATRTGASPRVAGGLGGGSRSRPRHAMPAATSVTRPTAASSPTMSGRELGGRVPARAHRADPLAVTHHGQRVADRHGLADLVGDEHDAHALVDDGPQRAEQRVDLLRREVRRRLVEHEDLGSAVERLEDLHPLAQADRQVRRPRPGVDRQAEPLGELGDAGRRLLEVDRRPGRQRGAEHDVLGHRVGVHLEEVLVDHADPGEMASRGSRISTAEPSSTTDPPSGRYSP